jgi:tetratricopeptide (TPR) repeat protein
MQKVIDLKAEILRIKAKLSASSDHDIIEALQFKLGSLNDQLANAVMEVEDAELAASALAVIAPAEEIPAVEIEQQIRLARAHIAGDRKAAAREIMARLEKASPNNIDVLELKADMLIASKDIQNAFPLLKKAHKVDPTNVTVEKKLAEVAMRAATMGSIDDQLRTGISSSLITEGDLKATPTAATVCSVFLPGLGHLFVGMTTKGIIYITVWTLSVVPFAWLMRSELNRIHGNMNNLSPSMLMIFLFFVAAMCWFVALFECASLGKRAGSSKRPVIEHPKPPVDLPFE